MIMDHKYYELFSNSNWHILIKVANKDKRCSIQGYRSTSKSSKNFFFQTIQYFKVAMPTLCWDNNNDNLTWAKG